MFLEEKIEKLKQGFPAADFKIPFTEGSNILKSIEAKFITVKDISKDLSNTDQYFNNWANNIKRKNKIKTIVISNHQEWLNQLDVKINYWVVTVNSNSPSTKHLVFDCKPNSLIALFSIVQDDFFIVDKKYKWFSFFKLNSTTKQATIFKGGQGRTPFEI